MIGASGGYQRVCQSKWIKGKRIGPEAVDELLQQAELVYKDMDAITVTPWIFAFEGLSSKAEELAKSKGVLWSDIEDFNGLLDHVGLRKLPEL